MQSKNSIFPISLLIFTIYYIFSAWAADDAYITFRTIENFHNGYGLRWNIIERVQSYTHPLWMFNLLIGKYIIKDLYFLVIILGYIYSTLTIYLIFLLSERKFKIFTLIFFILLSSKAFIDFSSSGLENSLSYFLITLFFYVFIYKLEFKYSYFLLSLILSMMFLNRMDLIIPVLPIAIYLFFIKSYSIKKLKKSILQGFLGFIPIILWSSFSLYYYGSFFANSVIAKTNLGLPISQLQIQGFSYLYDNFKQDPITSTIIYYTLIYCIFLKEKIYKILALGLFLNLIYIINIGADYMYGRFLTIPFIISICILVISTKLSLKKFQIAFILILPFLIFNFYHYILKGNFNSTNQNFTDERLFYYNTTGLLPILSGDSKDIDHHFSETKELFTSDPNKATILSTMGFNGYIVSQIYPQKHIIDSLGLTDPFLAVHPMSYGYWRSGHYSRSIPLEYINSVNLKKNTIIEPNDRDVLNQIWLISRAPLNSPNRFQAILDYNTGHIAKNAKKAFEIYPYMINVSSNMSYLPNLWLNKNTNEKPILIK